MERLLIINGSPRAPKSNSKKYIDLLKESLPGGTEVVEINVLNRRNRKYISELNQFSDILIVFPLYVDTIPMVLMEYLKEMGGVACPKTRFHFIVNGGFFESHQSDIAMKIIEYYCRKNDFQIGMKLQIGAGEAMLRTFPWLAKFQLARFAKKMILGKKETMTFTMPLTRTMFLLGSKFYWTNYGKQYGCTKKEMETLKIEGK